MAVDPMSPDQQHGSDPAMIYCPQCGQAMRIAREHLHVPVSCPHCHQAIEPWRVATLGAPPSAPPIEPPGMLPGRPFEGYSSRSKVVAGLLGIFLGGLGIHRFYLGYTGVGVIQLILLYPTCGATHLWGFVEGIMCFSGHLSDVDGLPLRD